jgi:predicted aldo/keto reductase-like oxidoreductase
MPSLVSYNDIIYKALEDHGDNHGNSSAFQCKNCSFLLVIVLCPTHMEQDIDELLEEVENRFINKDNEDRSRKFLTTNTFSSHSSFRYCLQQCHTNTLFY